MKRRILRHKFALGLVAILILASCSQDEFADKQDTLLPEGVFPLEIASVTLDVESDAPQTRVSENGTGSGSVWNDGDQITVQIGNGEPGIYTMDGNGSLTAETPAYWESSDDNQTITAWHPEGESINLSNQSNGLAYVLQATTQANFNTSVSLSFKHSLSKIRVKLTGDKATNVTSVQVKSYTQCTHNKGTVSGSDENWITMKECTYESEKCWEANVVPGYEITEIQLNGNTPCTLTSNVKPEAGNCHEITINVEGKDFTVTEDYTIEGEHKPIIIAGDYIVTFKNARITSNDRPVIKINDGCRPTLVFEGTNVLKGSITSGEEDEYSIELKDNAKLAVISEGTPIGSTYDRIRLKISGDGEMWVQSNGHDSPAIIVKNGSLDVSGGVDLTAVATNISWGNIGKLDYIPAIGRAAYVSGVTGGEITLSNCTLKLYAWAKGDKEPQNWVTLENNGTVTPDVDGALKSAEWDTEVTLSNNVKVTKLKERPTPPEWAK